MARSRRDSGELEADSDTSGSEYHDDSDTGNGLISDEEDIDPALQPESKAKAPRKSGNGRKAVTTQLTRQLFQDFEADDDDAPAPVLFADDDSEDEYTPHSDDMMDVDDDNDILDNLRNAAHMKSKRPKGAKNFKRQVMNNKDLDPEKRTYMSRGNAAFARGDLETAWKNYVEVIKIDNKSYNAYKTLAEICHMQGKVNKCCNYLLMAALSNPSDTQLWAQAAELSADLGHVDQAIHCYTKAISTKDNSNDFEYILERSMLYKKKKQYGRALDGLQRLALQYPDKNVVIKCLADVYVQQKRVNDAISLYNRVLDRNMNPSEHTKAPSFEWSELNILTELYIAQESWVPAINTIKLVSRWIHKRQDETWWEEQDLDAEFDERRGAAIKRKKPELYEKCANRLHYLPIDIRFKLGFLRLELDQKDESLRHYSFLFREEDKSDVADLFFEAGKHLESKTYAAEAIPFLHEVKDEEQAVEVAALLGKCYTEIGEFDSAIIQLSKACNGDPDNLEYKSVLCEALYNSGDHENAGKLLEEIDKLQALNEKKQAPEATEETPEEKLLRFEDEDTALIRSVRAPAGPKKEAMTEEDRAEHEKLATRNVAEKIKRMKKLEEGINQGHKVAASAWMALASQLIDMFTSIKAFFPKSRKSTFRGIVMYLRHKRNMDINSRLARLHDLQDGMNDTGKSRVALTATKVFRGLSYDEWLYIFVQHALLLRQFNDDVEKAIDILEVAFDASVFVQDTRRVMILRLARMSLAMSQQDFIITVCHNIRYVLSLTQFSPTIYNIFMCCFSSGISAWAAFSNYNHQKYFLRQLKAYDSLLSSSKVSGAAHVTVDVKNMKFEKELPQLLYVYACLLGGNRSFSSPIVYLTRAYKQCYNDPTICFMLGLAHVHRSIQRNTSNRHMQLLQGISFLLEYREIRMKNSTAYELQEIEYNFGRLFHMLGLPALAIAHYNKALEFHEQLQDDSSYDLSAEAAYNLTLIYTISGNTKMTQELIDKYLTI